MYKELLTVWRSTLLLLVLLCAAFPAFVKAQSSQDDRPLRIVVFGAHPDDCELKAGGMAILWAKAGHKVKFVSATNGDIGHAEMAGGPLARRRIAEVKAAAKIFGVESEVLDIHDGELMPTLENRKKFARVIREWKADIVIGHRPNDYHPDHRYTGVLMQDASYMVTVAFYLPDVPQLAVNPVFLFLSDNFQKPNPFAPNVVVAIDDVFQQKADAIWNIESQIESLWATGNFEKIIPVPAGGPERAQRRKEFDNWLGQRSRQVADKYRDLLADFYGEKGKSVVHAEAFELCEYGRQPSMEELKHLFLLD